MEYLHSDLSSKLINLYFEVYNDLPYGLETDFYRNGLNQKLELAKIKTEKDKNYPLLYFGKNIGEVKFDFLIADKVGIEILNKETFIDENDIDKVRAKVLVSPVEVVLIFNFTKEHNHKRYFYSNEQKRKLNK